jgi:antitoxin component YwqK of YwqJK toxin-antitoxin module
MKFKFHFVLILFAFLATANHALAQQKSIEFLHDTILLEHDDSVYYRIGDQSNGEIKYGRWGFSTELKIEDGWITCYRHFYRNGIMSSEFFLSKGKVNGETRKWNENGALVEIGFYNQGLEDSVWTCFRDDGSKEMECRYLPDSTALVNEFYTVRHVYDPQTGEPISVASLGPRSPAHGKWVFYDRKENVIKQLWFDRGKLVGMEYGER